MYALKLDKLKNALLLLNEAIADFNKFKLLSVRDGVIWRFKVTSQTALKAVGEYLSNQGIFEIDTPKAAMREAFKLNIIEDENGWLRILHDFDLTTHIYEDNEADEIFDRIKNKHLELLKKLYDKLSSLN